MSGEGSTLLRSMTNQIKKIVVAYCLSDPRAKQSLHNQIADDETLLIARATQKALHEGGFVADLVEFSFDRMNDFRAYDWVFNLAESVSGYPATDAEIAKAFEEIRIPFTGAGSKSLADCEHKALAKSLFQKNRITTPEYFTVPPGHEAQPDLSFPLIVKPMQQDGSIGITQDSVVHTSIELKDQVARVQAEFNQDALIEEFIDGRDISISVVGSHNRLFTLPPSECIYLNSSKERILTYDSKWIAESHDYRITEVQCPIYLAPGLEQTLRRTSLLAFEVMGCRDYARMDFRVRGDSPYLLEVNPNPCLHPEEAGFTRSWKATGKSFNQLIYQILQSSYENYQS